MKKQTFRPEKVGQQVLREIAQLMQFEVKDPRLECVNIVDVEMSRDLSHAKIFFSVLEETRDIEEILAGFEKCKGYLRTKLGKLLKLRIIPDLHFVYDQSLAYGNHLSMLIDSALKADKKISTEDNDG